MTGTGPAGMPASTSMKIAPPMPARFIASKSAVIPSRLRLPFATNQYTQGRVSSGGLRNWASVAASGGSAAAAASMQADSTPQASGMNCDRFIVVYRAAAVNGLLVIRPMPRPLSPVAQ